MENSDQREFRIRKRPEIFLTFCASHPISAFHSVESFAFTKRTEKILGVF